MSKAPIKRQMQGTSLFTSDTHNNVLHKLLDREYSNE